MHTLETRVGCGRRRLVGVALRDASGSTAPDRSSRSRCVRRTPTELRLRGERERTPTSGARRDGHLQRRRAAGGRPWRGDRAFSAPATITATATDRAGLRGDRAARRSAVEPAGRPPRTQPTKVPIRIGGRGQAAPPSCAIAATARGAGRQARASAGVARPGGHLEAAGLPAPGERARRAAAPVPAKLRRAGQAAQRSPSPADARRRVRCRRRSTIAPQARPPLRRGRWRSARASARLDRTRHRHHGRRDRSVRRARARAVLAPLRRADADPAPVARGGGGRRARRRLGGRRTASRRGATRPATSSSPSPPRPAARRAPTVILQGHLDIVCERDPDSPYDPRAGPDRRRPRRRLAARRGHDARRRRRRRDRRDARARRGRGRAARAARAADDRRGGGRASPARTRSTPR